MVTIGANYIPQKDHCPRKSISGIENNIVVPVPEETNEWKRTQLRKQQQINLSPNDQANDYLQLSIHAIVVQLDFLRVQIAPSPWQTEIKG